jgi:hypothetical protein
LELSCFRGRGWAIQMTHWITVERVRSFVQVVLSLTENLIPE